MFLRDIETFLAYFWEGIILFVAYLFLQKPCRIKQKWIILGFKYDLNDPLVLLVHIKSKQDLEKQSFAK